MLNTKFGVKISQSSSPVHTISGVWTLACNPGHQSPPQHRQCTRTHYRLTVLCMYIHDSTSSWHGLVGGESCWCWQDLGNATVANRGRGQFPVSRVCIASMVLYLVPRLRPLPLHILRATLLPFRAQHVPALPSHCIRWLDGPCLDGCPLRCRDAGAACRTLRSNKVAILVADDVPPDRHSTCATRQMQIVVLNS